MNGQYAEQPHEGPIITDEAIEAVFFAPADEALDAVVASESLEQDALRELVAHPLFIEVFPADIALDTVTVEELHRKAYYEDTEIDQAWYKLAASWLKIVLAAKMENTIAAQYHDEVRREHLGELLLTVKTACQSIDPGDYIGMFDVLYGLPKGLPDRFESPDQFNRELAKLVKVAEEEQEQSIMRDRFVAQAQSKIYASLEKAAGHHDSLQDVSRAVSSAVFWHINQPTSEQAALSLKYVHIVNQHPRITEAGLTQLVYFLAGYKESPS